MVIASSNLTGGSEFPMDRGVPRSLTFISPLETLPPGSAEPWSKGICGLTDAQPNNIRPTRDARTKMFFFVIMFITPLNFPLLIKI
jgi:hypothetical protein